MLELGSEVFLLYLDGSNEDNELNVLATTVEDYEKFMARKKDEDPRRKLPKYLHPLAATFLRKESKELPKRRPGVDIEIHLKLDIEASYKKPYRMS